MKSMVAGPLRTSFYTNFRLGLWSGRAPNSTYHPDTNHREIKGRFRKLGWFWHMCPRSGFRSGGACERTLVPVFVPGEHPNVPSFRFSFRGERPAKPPFWKPPFCQPLNKWWQTSLIFCGRNFRITLRRQMQIEFLSLAKSDFLVDADALSMLGAVYIIVADLMVGMEEFKLHQMQRQI